MAWGKWRGNSKAKERGESASLVEVEAKAMSLLGMRDHGTEELRKKLAERHYPEALIDQALERMASYNYLNDEETARKMAASLARQGWGPMRVKLKLRERSYSSQEIDEAMELIDDPEQWATSARERIELKYRCGAHELDEAQRLKARRHLASRGFTGGTLRDVFSKKS